MILPLCWTLTALASQIPQPAFDNGYPNNTYANISTPTLLGLRFKLRRELKNSTDMVKRRVKVSKTIRSVNYCYYIDFNLGNPLRHIQAELNFRYRGTYIVTRSKSEIFNSQMYSAFRLLRLHEYVESPATSSTYHRSTDFFTTQSSFYGTAYAAFAEDDLYIGVPVLEKFKFLMVEHETESSMIGLGLPGTSGYVSTDYPATEDSTNLFDQMRNKGWYQRHTYSMWIGDESSKVPGVVLFNSIDYKYTSGDMYVFPLVYPDGQGYYIKLDGVTLVSPNNTVTYIALCSMAMELDFTKPFTSLPEEIVRMVYVTYEVELGEHPRVSCKEELPRGSLGLIFNGVQFIFPFNETLPNCMRGAEHSIPAVFEGKPILGANFLSMLYMVFDIDNREVGLAKARTDLFFESETYLVSKLGDKKIPGSRAPFFSCTDNPNTFILIEDPGFTRNNTDKCLFEYEPPDEVTSTTTIDIYQTLVLVTVQFPTTTTSYSRRYQ